jgi:hypothetical protein
MTWCWSFAKRGLPVVCRFVSYVTFANFRENGTRLMVSTGMSYVQVGTRARRCKMNQSKQNPTTRNFSPTSYKRSLWRLLQRNRQQQHIIVSNQYCSTPYIQSSVIPLVNKHHIVTLHNGRGGWVLYVWPIVGMHLYCLLRPHSNAAGLVATTMDSNPRRTSNPQRTWSTPDDRAWAGISVVKIRCLYGWCGLRDTKLPTMYWFCEPAISDSSRRRIVVRLLRKLW